MDRHPLVPVVRAWLAAAGLMLLCFAWPELALAVPLILMPNPCCCGCVSAGLCPFCEDDEQPCCWELVVEDVVNAGCVTCESANGTWLVGIEDNGIGSQCRGGPGDLTGPGYCTTGSSNNTVCGNNGFPWLVIRSTGTKRRVEVNVNGSGFDILRWDDADDTDETSCFGYTSGVMVKASEFSCDLDTATATAAATSDE